MSARQIKSVDLLPVLSREDVHERDYMPVFEVAEIGCPVSLTDSLSRERPVYPLEGNVNPTRQVVYALGRFRQQGYPDEWFLCYAVRCDFTNNQRLVRRMERHILPFDFINSYCAVR